MRRQTAAVFVLILAVAAGCGSSIKHANSALTVALKATDAARDSFVTWDRDHQQRLVDTAKTVEEAQAAVKAYRNKRASALQAFTKAYAAIAAAAAVIPLVEHGTKDDVDLVELVIHAARAAEEVKKALAALREGS